MSIQVFMFVFLLVVSLLLLLVLLERLDWFLSREDSASVAGGRELDLWPAEKKLPAA